MSFLYIVMVHLDILQPSPSETCLGLSKIKDRQQSPLPDDISPDCQMQTQNLRSESASALFLLHNNKMVTFWHQIHKDVKH